MKAFILKHPRLSLVVGSFLLSAIILLLSSSLCSFLYPNIAMQPYYNDPSAFVIMGKEMALGKVPYKEIFDHKGLYIFYVTFIYAYLGKFGMFLVMSLFITTTLVFYFLCLKTLGFNNRTILVGLLFFTSLYVFFAQFPGDADAIVTLGMMMFYFYLRGNKEQKDYFHLAACVLAGVSAGIAINIRPSDAMLGFAFMIFFIVKSIREKKIFNMFMNSLLCILALIFTALPAFIHSMNGGFFNEMFDAVIFSNFKYLGSANDKNVVLVWLSRLIVTGIFGGIIALWAIKRKEYEMEQTLFVLIISSILFLLQFVIALFAHYLISVSGFISLALMIVIDKYKLLEGGKATKPICYAMVGVFALSLLFNPVLYLTHVMYDKGDIAYMKENISEEDRKDHTLLFSVYPGLYLNTGVRLIYPDFNAQTYHFELSDIYTKARMAEFVQSENVKYFVARKGLEDISNELFGSANYIKIDNLTKLPTTIVIYKHVL